MQNQLIYLSLTCQLVPVSGGTWKSFKKEHMKKKITQEEIRAETNANWFSDPCAKREPSHWTYCQSDLTVKNVLPPTLLTLHIPHAPVLFSFLSLSHSCRVPWISALKFRSPVLNGWMHQSWFGILNRVLHIESSVNKKEGGSTSSKGFSWVWNNVCCERDYCRCCRGLTEFLTWTQERRVWLRRTCFCFPPETWEPRWTLLTAR